MQYKNFLIKTPALSALWAILLIITLVYLGPSTASAASTTKTYSVSCSSSGKLSLKGNKFSCSKGKVKISASSNGNYSVTCASGKGSPKVSGSSLNCSKGGSAKVAAVNGAPIGGGGGGGGGGQNPQTPNTSGQSQINAGPLPTANADPTAIHSVLTIVFGVIGSLALLMISVSGLRYVLSAGDPQKITQAKNGIIYALVGLAIAIAAEAIVSYAARNL